MMIRIDSSSLFLTSIHEHCGERDTKTEEGEAVRGNEYENV